MIHFYRKNLGGKLGLILTQELKLQTIGDLARLNQNFLIDKFGDKTGFVVFSFKNHLIRKVKFFFFKFIQVNGYTISVMVLI